MLIYYIYSSNKESSNKESTKNIELINDNPIIKIYYNLLSKKECEYIINLGKKHIEKSTIEGNKSPNRTSNTCYLDIYYKDDKILNNIKNNISNLVKYDVKKIELQLTKYNPGEFYKSHYDWVDETTESGRKQMKIAGSQRKTTIFIYLNNFNGRGGETEFPKLKIKRKLSQGSGLFWNNVNKDNKVDYNTLHQGNPPLDDIKYGLNVWIY